MVEQSLIVRSTDRPYMVDALKAALGRLEHITAELCVAYLRAWIADQERWQRHIRRMQRQPRERALKSLARRGGPPLTWCTNKGRSRPEPAAGSRRRRTLSAHRLRPLQVSDLEPMRPAP